MKLHLISGLIVILLNYLGVSEASCAETTITSNGDTYIRSNAGNANYDGDAYMVANDNGSNVRMAVFRFDISTVPPGTIAAAKLQLTDVVGNYNGTFDVYGLLDSAETFDETTLTWNSAGFLSGNQIDLTKVYGGAKLGSFSNVKNSLNTVFDVTSGNFLNFLNASGDHDVTFVIVDTSSASGGSGWAVHENPVIAKRPTLILNNEIPPVSPVTKVRVFLVGGQSNADGRAAVSGLPTSPVNLQQPQSDVDFYYKVEGGSATLTTLRPGLSETSGFGPAITMGRKLADLYAGEVGTRIALIKYANGGTNLHTQWKAGGDNTTTGDGPEYATFQQTVTSGLAALAAAHPSATIELNGMVWMQGESDTNATRAPAYQANLTNFIADIRATYGAALPFTIGRLSDAQTGLNATYRSQIQAAQDAVALADPQTGIVNTDAFAMKGDHVHFNAAGQQSLGTGFAQETAYFIWMGEHFTPEEISAGLAEPNADPDGDGKTNRTEFIGNSSPKDATSQFKSWLTVPNSTTAVIYYHSSSLRRYAIEQYQPTTKLWVEILPYELGDGSVKIREITPIGQTLILRVRSDLP